MARPLLTSFVLLLLWPPVPAAAAQELPDQCLWKFEHHAAGEKPVVCMCGPPGDTLLTLEPLTDELGVERPKYEGSIIQQVGGIIGTHSYAGNSSVCMSAQHAGLLEDSANVGGIVTFARTKGCERYEGTTKNGMRSQDSGSRAVSYYFPALTNGGCPGEAGYGNRYAGGPALDVLLGMLSLALPRDAVRYQSAESHGIEAFSVERLFLRPPGKAPIAVGKLSVERIDMEYAILKLPPRYLTVRAEQVSLPSSYLGPVLETAFEGARLSLDVSLDLYFNLEVGRLELKDARVAIDGQGTLSLQARLAGLSSGVFYGDEQGAVRLAWARLRVEDEGLLARLLPVWWHRGQPASADELRQALQPALAEAKTGAGPRYLAILAAFDALLTDLDATRGPVVLHLQSPTAPTFGEIAALYDEDPEQALQALRAAFFYGAASAEGERSTLAATETILAAGEAPRLRFSGASGRDDQIVLHAAGDVPGSSRLAYWRLGERTDGEVTGTPVEAGLYEAVLLSRSEAGQLAPAAFAWFLAE